MEKLITIFIAELKKTFWNSPLQMAAAGLLLYYISLVVGPTIACGNGNTDLNRRAFVCLSGEMATVSKLLIFAGMALASLSLGRAVSLLQRKRELEK